MAHHHHFLSRLDRVTEAQVECALSLYRDERLVRFIIERANMPENGRIAISLDRDEGPFVVLASDGHFVTCLGRGMFPTGHPVFSKAWLDRAIADWTTYREGLARGSERNAGHDSGLFHAVSRRAHTFSREDFKALRVVAEFLGPIWFDWMTKSDAFSTQFLVHAEQAWSARSPLKDDLVDEFWKAAWGASHSAVLGGCAGEEVVREFAQQWPVRDQSPTALSWMPDVNVLTVRAMWLVAEHAESFLPVYDRVLGNARTDHTVADAVIGLMAMAIRWPSLRKPVVRVLEERQVLAKHVAVRDSFRALAMKYIDNPRAADDFTLKAGRMCARPWRHEASEPSDELAMAYGLVFPSDCAWALLELSDEPWRGGHRVAAVASAARRDPEFLFLPESELRRTVFPPNDLARACVRRRIENNRNTKPVRTPVSHAGPRVDRNDPCPCGSGKKFKKCCLDGRPNSGTTSSRPKNDVGT